MATVQGMTCRACLAPPCSNALMHAQRVQPAKGTAAWDVLHPFLVVVAF
jgi:hypothetical protein